MAEYQLKPGKVGQKVIDGYKKVEEKFTDTFLEKDENSPSGYTLKTGKGVVGAYKKVENAFVDRFLEKVEGNDNEEK